MRISIVAIRAMNNGVSSKGKGGFGPPFLSDRSEPPAREARMSKPYRDASSGVGLDVVVTLPAPVVEQIEAQAKEHGETVEGWRRAELVALVEGQAGGRGAGRTREEDGSDDVENICGTDAGAGVISESSAMSGTDLQEAARNPVG